MSHTTKAVEGTIFHHNGDYSGDVNVIGDADPVSYVRADGSPALGIKVPFADLRELVFAYLRDRRIEQLEQASDDELEAGLQFSLGAYEEQGDPA